MSGSLETRRWWESGEYWGVGFDRNLGMMGTMRVAKSNLCFHGKIDLKLCSILEPGS